MTLKLFLLILVSTFAFSNCAKKEKDNGPLLASAAIIIQQQSGSTSYSIGGSITGLTTTGLVLQNNSGDDLTVAANATTFSFTTKVTGAYAVTVKNSS